MHPLKKIIKQNKEGASIGICSVCSSNELVIESAMEEALKYGVPLLVEATANQVNQYGGYTGMTPPMFRDYVYKISEKSNYPVGKLILGGDHLGPLIWNDENERDAMAKAEDLVVDFVEAGFTKIHLDTSMKLQDDGEGRLSSEVIAERGASLCAAAEKAFQGMGKGIQRPVYVIGSEVPIPGGTQTNEGLKVTSASDFVATVDLFKKSFLNRGLNEAWENVIAVVVQPGVEFGSNTIHDYNRSDSAELKQIIKEYPTMAFEGHSTDYQKESSLRQMVEDGIAILKVGPALTFALREGLISLELIEKELLFGNDKLSKFADTLENVMVSSPNNWQNHYKGNELQKQLARRYSYSDRCRYYLGDSKVKNSIDVLIHNLRAIKIPMPLISQYLPSQYWKIRDGHMSSDPIELVKGSIKDTLDNYYAAVTVSGNTDKNVAG
jgi:D-tagatose-1,6-bisphosphate aldolase subunit GatZ/KbaZ